MQLAMVAADFTADEADELRRSMAAWRRKGGLEKFEAKLKNGMRKNRYPEEFADRIFRQIRGFAEYGFPESHSSSFALLAYVSSWLKHYEPAAFLAALLNSQPMGFYSPSQLVQDARRHGVEVRAADVTVSDWECTLEQTEDGPTAASDTLSRDCRSTISAAPRVTGDAAATRCAQQGAGAASGPGKRMQWTQRLSPRPAPPFRRPRPGRSGFLGASGQ